MTAYFRRSRCICTIILTASFIVSCKSRKNNAHTLIKAEKSIKSIHYDWDDKTITTLSVDGTVRKYKMSDIDSVASKDSTYKYIPKIKVQMNETIKMNN